MDINISNTFFTGKFLLQLPETPSTNSYAKEWLTKNKPIEGAVILTENQTAGRGQAGNSWIADSGLNLTFSILYHPKFLAIQKQFILSMAIANGVRDALQSFLPEKKISVKWPNDIYAGNKKLGGILIENVLSGNSFQTAIIGIGINIYQSAFYELSAATSLVLEGWNGDKWKVLESVLQQVEKNYLLLKSGDVRRLHKAYLSQQWRMDELITFQDKDGEFEGKIYDIAADGALQIMTETGIRSYYFKEVAWLPAGD